MASNPSCGMQRSMPTSSSTNCPGPGCGSKPSSDGLRRLHKSCPHELCVNCIWQATDLKRSRVVCPLCRAMSPTVPTSGADNVASPSTSRSRTVELHPATLSEKQQQDSATEKRQTENGKCEKNVAARRAGDINHGERSGSSFLSPVASRIDECNRALSELEAGKETLLKEIEEIEKTVSQYVDNLKRLIDDHREKLVEELTNIKYQRVKELETAKQEVEMQLCELQSFSKRCAKEMERMATDVEKNERAAGLAAAKNQPWLIDVKKLVMMTLTSRAVNFRLASSTWLQNASTDEVIGSISVGKNSEATEGHSQPLVRADPVLKHIVPKGANFLAGIASIDNELYVTCIKSREILVYDVSKATDIGLNLTTPLRTISMPAMGSNPWGVATCRVNRCLYISDASNCYVHRVDLTNNRTITKWSVAKSPCGLSLNAVNNVFVVCQADSKIQEFTTHGQLVREVSLQPAGVGHPWQAVQLPSTGQFVVSHDTPTHRVCLVDASGHLELVFGVQSPLHSPRGIAVTSDGRVLVADKDNNRILILDRTPGITGTRELCLQVEGGLQGPLGLCLDESNDRLCVTEWKGQRVLVFGGIKEALTAK